MRASGRSSPSIVALAIVAGVAAVALVAVLPGSGVARAEPYAKPWLFNGAIGFGIEPQRRVKADCELAQCGQLVAFSLAAEVLWRGFIGPAAAIWASEGQPLVSTPGQPGFGDRISVPLAVAVRPFAPLLWRRGSEAWVHRLVAGIGVEAGVAIEHARIALESRTTAGFHGVLLLDVPLFGANTSSGVAFRIAARLRAGADAKLGADPQGTPQIVGPGTAAQLCFGFAWYM